MTIRRSIASFLLIAPLALGAALPIAAAQDQKPAPASQTEPTTTAIGVPASLVTPKVGEQLPAAVRTISGAADVVWVASPPSLVVRGTPEQIDRARRYIEEMAHDAEAMNREAIVRAAKRDASALIDVDFPGGTLRDYLQSLQKASGYRNVVVSQEELYAVPLPAIALSSVTPHAAVRVLESMPFTIGSTRGWVRLQQITQMRGEEQPVFVATLEKESTPGGAKRQPVITRVFDLSTLQKYEPEQLKALLEAIGVGIELVGQSNEFATKFHPGSGLFFVKGTPSDIDVVEQAIETKVGRRAPTQPTPTPDAPSSPAPTSTPAGNQKTPTPTPPPTTKK